MIIVWSVALVRRRGWRLVGIAAGIAVAVALLGSLGSFVAASKATMTARAAAGVAVDWQVAVVRGGDPAAVLTTVRDTPGTLVAAPVGFAATPGLAATTAPRPGTTTDASVTTQTTGPGVALGLPPGYAATFPGALRLLAGSGDGVLLAQQTAANLHAVPGDTIRIGRPGLDPAPATVSGIVALPQADTLFRRIGSPPGAQPTAPPDNVVLLPAPAWHAVFDPVAPAHPDGVSTQVHASRDHRLPPDPAVAYTQVTGAARNLEARAAGAALVGDNLGSTLDLARQDAAYAQVLFLFLGAPGAVLAALLTAAVAAAAADRRRREQALLRLRGADAGVLLRLGVVEAAVVAVLGVVVGLAAAAVIGRVAFGSVRFGASSADATVWVTLAAIVGALVAGGAVVLPVWRDLRSSTVAAGRTTGTTAARARSGPAWARLGLDVVLLVAGAGVVWLIGRGGNQLVVAPEGTPTISVSYWAFVGPALLWAGGGLLAWRLLDLLLGRGRNLVARGLLPVSGSMAPLAASVIARRRRVLARSAVLLGLALAFAASTAVFNTTYRVQAEVDAQLTNGADVTVTEPPGARVGPAAALAMAGVPGIRAVEPMQHRFAYVGADLQDLYGVDPATITRATTVTDRYFQGGTARELLDRLAAAPDSILVSAETVTDFQLQPGDLLNLRLPDDHPGAAPGAQVTVPFHYAGVVTEFPTAPKDSFLVADRGYVAAATGSDAVGAFLVDTGGARTAEVAAALRDRLGPTAGVTDISASRGHIGSSLAAVDLAGLTRVELGFAVVLALAAGGLVFALGMAERRRGLAIAGLLGAQAAHLRRLVAGEAVVLGVGGLVLGAVLGATLAETLVVVLSGVFDPPPTVPSVPWAYLVAVAVAAAVALLAATAVTTRLARRGALTVLREL